MITGSLNSNSAGFNFSFTTSSGDKIDLKMFDSLTTSVSQSDGYKEYTLQREFGYEFHYEGNGLDKNDIKEIKEAFKKIKPLLKKFLEQKESNDIATTNFVHQLKSMLPLKTDENTKNYMKNEGVKTFDDVLKEIKASFEELKKAKELFDRLFDNSKKLEVFA
ncbi:MAG: ATP/GTP-binding protein [Epsilonproteobacteria bacterium]|nr:ATP/GTP-binding protein [Campylobacterota bacterium]